jgi:hypothetical protein
LTAAERFQAFLEQSSKNRSAKAAAASKGSAVRDATTATSTTTAGTAGTAGTGTAGVNGGVSAGGGSRVTGVHTLQHPGAANLMLQVLQQLVVCISMAYNMYCSNLRLHKLCIYAVCDACECMQYTIYTYGK